MPEFWRLFRMLNSSHSTSGRPYGSADQGHGDGVLKWYFDGPVKWLGLPPDAAIEFAELVKQKALELKEELPKKGSK